MKKLLAILMTLCLLCSVCALAESKDQTITDASKDNTATTTLSVTLSESYTVVIPSELTITPDTANTDLPIEVTSLRLLPTGTIDNSVRAVWVELDQPSFKLVNNKDSNSTIAYNIGGGSGTYGRVLKFTETGTQNYTVSISENAWNSAAAGTYTDTVTFTVTITNISKN